MTATVLAVVNQKGGVGKTTLSMNMAAGLQRRGSCMVVDVDPQGSAGLWARGGNNTRRYPVPVVHPGDSLGDLVAALRPQHDYLVLDCPPASESKDVAAAVTEADVVLVPVLPSPMDLWASTRIEEMINQARSGNGGLRAFLVLNQVEARNAMSRDIEEVLREFSVPALRSGLNRRAIYRTAALEGCSVYELGARGRPARNEVEAIIEEVLQS